MRPRRDLLTRVIAALLPVLCTVFPTALTAGTQEGAMIVLHVQAHTAKNSTMCTTAKPTVPCSQYTTGWPVQTLADVYLVVVRAKPEPGIAGLSCGIDYDGRSGQGIDIFGYQLCADLEYPNAGANGVWPAAGGGNRITWSAQDACQRTVIETDGVHAIAGVFYVYAYDRDYMEVTENKNLAVPEIAVADCSASTTFLNSYFDCAGPVFGGMGCNPCLYDCHCPEVRPSTWGGVKRSFMD